MAELIGNQLGDVDSYLAQKMRQYEDTSELDPHEAMGQAEASPDAKSAKAGGMKAGNAAGGGPTAAYPEGSSGAMPMLNTGAQDGHNLDLEADLYRR